jgi:copper resistance protein C
MTRVFLRLAAAAVATCVALVLGAAPASAHARLESSIPADGSSVASAPDTVSLTFSDDVQAEFASITLVGPDGTNYQTGDLSATGGTVTTSVKPLGPAGAYTIGYRVVSDDGHPVQGEVAFTLTAPGPASATAAAAAPAAAATAESAPAVAPQANAQGSSSAPVWPWILGAVILVGAGAAAALRLGRRT